MARSTLAGVLLLLLVLLACPALAQKVPDAGVSNAPAPSSAFDAGGPDASGYRWADSNQAGGPYYSFSDISTTGTAVTPALYGCTARGTGAAGAADEGRAAVALPFAFPFYGAYYSTVYVYANGLIGFDPSFTGCTYNNAAIPSSAAPNGLIAPFWDDLNLTSGSIRTTTFYGGDFAIQFTNVPRYDTGTGSVTFQVILKPTGAVTFQYKMVPTTSNSATIGIENATGTTGLNVATNTAYAVQNLATRFTAPPAPPFLSYSPGSISYHLAPGQTATPTLRVQNTAVAGSAPLNWAVAVAGASPPASWLSTASPSGSTAAGALSTIPLMVSAAGLAEGTYSLSLVLTTNAPASPSVTIPATLVVRAVTPPTTNGWSLYTMANSGLPSDSITAVSWPWVGTTRGLSYRHPDGYWITATMANSDLPSDEITVIKDYGGNSAWVGTKRGLVRVGWIPSSGEIYVTREVVSGDRSIRINEEITALEYGAGYNANIVVGAPMGSFILYYQGIGCTPNGTNCEYLGSLLGSGPGRVVGVVNDGGRRLFVAVAGQGIYEYTWLEALGGGQWSRSPVLFARPTVGLCLENATDMAFADGKLYVAYTSYGSDTVGDVCTSAGSANRSALAPPRTKMGTYDGGTWTRSSRPQPGSQPVGDMEAPPELLPSGMPSSIAAIGNAVMIGLRPANEGGGGVAWTTDARVADGWTVFRAGEPGSGLPSNTVLTVEASGLRFAIGTTGGLAYYTLPDLAPTLLAPVANVARVPLAPRFAWRAPPGGASSSVQVSLSPEFASTVGEWSTTAQSLVLPQSLTPETPYFWRVRATLAGGGTSPWSAPQPFVTGAATVVHHGQGRGGTSRDEAGTLWTGLPYRLLAFDGTTWVSTTVPNLGYSGGPATAFTPAVARSARQPGVVWAGSEPAFGIFGPGFYKVYNGGIGRLSGGTWQTVVEGGRLDVNTGYPAVAAVSADVAWACEGTYAETAVLQSTTLVRFSSGRRETWDPLPCTVLAADAAGAVWVGSATGLTFSNGATRTTYLSGSSGLPSGAITAVAVAGDGKVWVGTTDGQWGHVARYDPASGTWATVPWDGPGIQGVGAAGEVVWVGTASGLARFSAGAWSHWRFENGALPPGGVTSVVAVDGERAFAMSAEGVTQFTAPASTPVLAEGGSLPEAFELSNPFPNPSRQGARLEFALPSASEVEIWVYDLLGRRVLNVASGARGAGWHTVQLDTGGLASGVYAVRAEMRPTAGGAASVLTRRLAVVR